MHGTEPASRLPDSALPALAWRLDGCCQKEIVKICLLLSTFAYDGIKRSVVHFANEMHRQGHDVWVGVLHDWPGKVSLRSELKIPSEKVISWDGLGQGRREWAMIRFFKKHLFDVVHCNTVKMNHLGRWTALIAGVRCILASEDNLCLNRSWKTRMEDRVLAHLTCGVVMISDAVRKSFVEVERLHRLKTHIIYYGLPCDDFDRIRLETFDGARLRRELGLREGPLVTLAARLHFSKSIETLIQAARSVIKKNPEVQFVIAGDGDERARLEQLSRDFHLENHVHFIGARTDIYDLFRISNVVTLCSLWEGLGFSLMEAMALGKPVVGTEVTGISEIIEHERNGLLTPAQKPEPYAECLLQLLTNPERAVAMGQEGVRTCREKFDIQKNTTQLLSLYHSLLDPMKH